MCGMRMDHGGAAAVQAAVGRPALLATVAAMSRTAKPEGAACLTRDGRAVVSVAVAVTRRCNSRVRGGGLRSQLAAWKALCSGLGRQLGEATGTPPARLPWLESKLLAAYRRVEGVDSDGSEWLPYWRSVQHVLGNTMTAYERATHSGANMKLFGADSLRQFCVHTSK